MSVKITKSGNVYKTTNKGKATTASLGAVAGGTLAYKNIDLIKKTAGDVYKNVIKQAGVATTDVLAGALNGNMDKKTVVENLKLNANVSKYATKLLNFVRKYPVQIGAVAGALAFVGIGAMVDNYINAKNAKEADLKK